MTAGKRTTPPLLLVIAVALTACVPSVAGAAVRYPTGAEIVAKLNAQRAAHDLPAVAEDPARAQGCAAHNHYVAVNGEDPANPHQETPGKPAYTPAGDQAARTSNLGGSSPFFSVWEDGNPYEDAPYHLADLLDPLAVSAGGAESEGYNCIGTGRDPGHTPPGSDAFFTYPGNGKPIPWFEVTVNEFPRTPGEVIGIPASTVTGPYLIAYWDGPPTDALDVLADATLTGPDGAVPVRVVGLGQDGASARSGFVIPTTPLRPASAYTATVSFTTGSSAGRRAAQPTRSASSRPPRRHRRN